MFCIKCGRQNVDEAVFCAFCGTQVTNSNEVITDEQPEEPVILEERAAYRGKDENEPLFSKQWDLVDEPAFQLIVRLNFLVLIILLFTTIWGFLVLLAINLMVFQILKKKSTRLQNALEYLTFQKIMRNIRSFRISPYVLYPIIAVIFLAAAAKLYYSSDYYEHSRFENSINSMIEKRDLDELKDKIKSFDEAPSGGTSDETKFNYILEQVIRNDQPEIKKYIEDSFMDFPISVRHKILETYKEKNISFSSIPKLLALLKTKGRSIDEEDISPLKTYPKAEVIKELESQIISDINNSDENSDFRDVSTKIDILTQYFGTTNEKIFNALSTIFHVLVEASNSSHSREVSKPTEPAYNKPEYKGVFYMNAEYVGPFQDGGLVIRSGGKYYLVSNGTESKNPFIKFYYGYFEKTGETITLNRGRSGTSCEVIRVRDEETFRDDQKEYQEKLENAKEDYRREMAEYQKDLVKYRNFSLIEKDSKQQINEQLFKAKGLIIQLL